MKRHDDPAMLDYLHLLHRKLPDFRDDVIPSKVNALRFTHRDGRTFLISEGTSHPLKPDWRVLEIFQSKSDPSEYFIFINNGSQFDVEIKVENTKLARRY